MFRNLPEIEVRIIQVAELKIKPCKLCFKVCAKKAYQCMIKDDFEMLFKEMKSADGIIIACPFYFKRDRGNREGKRGNGIISKRDREKKGE